VPTLAIPFKTRQAFNVLSHPAATQDVAGTIFGYDPATECLMLKQPGTHGGVANLRLIKASAIKVRVAFCSSSEGAYTARGAYTDRGGRSWGVLRESTP
jgi:hypothetical protein